MANISTGQVEITARMTGRVFLAEQCSHCARRLLQTVGLGSGAMHVHAVGCGLTVRYHCS
eukprot:1280245-Pyramimonas_sp.AAC.1